MATSTLAGSQGVVFNTASADVTLFDTQSNEVAGSKPTNAVVRWLSNEQRYWDGRHIWTYDYPDNEVRVVAIDPKTFKVSRSIQVGAKGPGHSFVLTTDNRRGFVNAAESNLLAVVDPKAGKVLDHLETGAYP